MDDRENTAAERPEASIEGESIRLAESSGYQETAELRQLRLIAVEQTKLADFETARAARARYHIAAQDQIEPLPDEIRARAQVGVMVAKGSIYLSASDMQTFAAELDDAITYAESMGYDDLANQLELLKPTD